MSLPVPRPGGAPADWEWCGWCQQWLVNTSVDSPQHRRACRAPSVAQGSPCRVQLSRAKGWRKPADTVVVARPSKWGNPHTHPELPDDVNRLISAFEYRAALTQDERLSVPCPPPLPYTVEDVRAELAGKNLACWCPLDQPCHADVLLEVANR